MKSLFFYLLLFISVSVQSQDKLYPTTIIVAKEGIADYHCIQDAVNAVRAYSPQHITIFIKNGIYKEKILMPSWFTNVSIIGENKDSTIISHADYSSKFISTDTINIKERFSTFNSYTLRVQGNDISIENLTIRNDAGRVGQAVALHVDGDRFVIKNCKLLGNQDTLLTASEGREYFDHCYIEGTTDFIFGNATAVFESCIIKSLVNSFITAASTTTHQQFGYVFLNCQLIASPEATKVYLGRPWRANAKVVFMNCTLGNHIRKEGWDNWGKKENESTAYFAEYNNTGEGANANNRVAWSYQLTKKEAKNYEVKNILGNWESISIKSRSKSF